MQKAGALWLICAFLLLCSCGPLADELIVDAKEHDSFWLWAGVKPQPVLDEAKTVYILEGELRAPDPTNLVSLRPAVPNIGHADIWMVVRVETLDWSPAVYDQVLSRIERWSAHNQLIGLQIDFDANTRDLDGYAEFLRDLRRRLPDRYKLSITGLLDWSANGDPAQLKELAGTIDEAVFQTYQGRQTIPGYESWFKNLDDLPMPFLIGVVQGGDWREPPSLPKNPNFRGYVVFLLNQPDVRSADS